ncbi:hypothetical protein BDV96DRAFT_648355 [Lophiotrema nucula]|uniref:AA1-like domain-containing protein n=1 Tax=Lophiotrema nucula TaxID=690887 RepID=A0A6A5Z1V9_9PLEO|nr:hypothetical protein BDV96DRAFT_648355 [Lophiotrema nucula]
MHFFAVASLLPALALAAPVVRQADPCVPTSYTISNYVYTPGSSSGSGLDFHFQSHFSNSSIIEDPASAGTDCGASSSTATLPGENECKTGRNNLYFDIRSQQTYDYELIHTWKCNGKTWMSTTHHVVSSVTCSMDDESGTTACAAPTQDFAPENAREICSTPTCP